MAEAKNSGIVRSVAAPAGAVGDDCTIVTLWDAESGGNFLREIAITGNPSPLALGQSYEIEAETLIIRQPVSADGKESEEMARRAVRGRVAGGVWVQYHTGSPGSDRDQNVITELGRTYVAEANFTVT